MRKNAHSVFPQNRFWVKGAIGWVFRVPAPIWGCYALLRSWAQYPHLPIAPTAFTEAACPPSPRHVPPHAAKFPHVPFPFDAIIVFLLIKQLSFPPCFPRPVLEYAADRRSLCRATEQGVYRVCKMASRSGRPRRSVRVSGLMPQNRWKMLRKRWRTLTTWSSPWTVSGIRLGASCSRGNTASAGMAGKSAGIPIRRVCQGTPVPRMIAATMTAMTINTLSDLFRS